MKEIIEDLFKMPRYLLGEGYDRALEYIDKILPLDVMEFSSGETVGDWTVPNEWSVREGWIKFNGEKICDLATTPLCVVNYSLPVNQKVNLEELRKHLYSNKERPQATSYDYKFYEKDWGFSLPHEQVEKLQEGEYEVFIDSSEKPGTMKIGVHTIKGESDREILLFAHLDHPFQANDNLSGVACLIDLAKTLKVKHTVKIIFCPETIGSIAYGMNADLTNVDFVFAVDAVGNKNSLLFQKAYNKEARINKCVHLAVAGAGVDYRKGEFRLVVGSDEYFFNDPNVGIPGIMFSRIPYDEYHTDGDTPDKIDYEKIKQVQDVIVSAIGFYENDFIPERVFDGPLMRSKYGIQTEHKLMNRELDYLWYDMDGKKTLVELILSLGMGFPYANSVVEKLVAGGAVKKVDETRSPYFS